MIVKLWPGNSEAPKTPLAEKIAQGGIVGMTARTTAGRTVGESRRL
jgi:hypothetical protein